MGIKRTINFRAKYRIRLFLQQFKAFTYFRNTTLDASKKKAYIFLAADYGNLGDVAITYAQTRFMQDNSDRQVVEIPISQSLEGFWFVKRHIQQGDIVTSVGGGNLGDMYDQIEYIRQIAVRSFPNNRFISFPQTFDFASTASGKKALKIAKKVYNSHPDIHFVAREKTSYSLMKKHFSNSNVLLTPDIVLSLDERYPRRDRSGALICMRKDKEKNLSPDQAIFIDKEVHNRFASVKYYDTHINRSKLTIRERKNELFKIWDAFKSAELVVTDRLHGMIFCYITRTPCLVFQNNNHKVRETYDWIKGNSSIKLVDKFSEEEIKTFLKMDDFHGSSIVDINDKYTDLISLLK